MTTPYSYVNQPMVQHTPVLMTKLEPPSSIHTLISRPRLLHRLNQGLEEKLTLICAPAGSGKTTLFTDWFRSSYRHALPVAWVSLDESDNDPIRFWLHVCTALEQLHPSIADHLPYLLETCVQSSEGMLIRLINLLNEAPTPFTLVLDDYHLLTIKPIHHALSFLLEHMPTHMHLVLLTRFEPSLPLARLRVRGQVVDIREADLRFTLEEVEQFVNEVMKLSLVPAHLEALAQRTEGWVAGLRLMALALHDRSDIDAFITSFTGSSRYIVDYLLEEVISHQSEAVQSFLLSTSILGRMCASLCASVLGPSLKQEEQQLWTITQPLDSSRSCQEMLEYLERCNLFLFPLDHEQHWYRYHQLFAQALLARLELLHPSLVPQLHAQASTWYEQQGMMSEAIEHALAIKDVVRVRHLQEQDMQTNGQPILTDGQESTAFVPLVALPREVPRVKRPVIDPLSERELEVLHVMAVGEPNAAIAQRLVIAPATVKRHLSNIFSKLGVTNRTQAVAQARNLGII